MDSVRFRLVETLSGSQTHKYHRRVLDIVGIDVKAFDLLAVAIDALPSYNLQFLAFENQRNEPRTEDLNTNLDAYRCIEYHIY